MRLRRFTYLSHRITNGTATGISTPIIIPTREPSTKTVRM